MLKGVCPMSGVAAGGAGGGGSSVGSSAVAGSAQPTPRNPATTPRPKEEMIRHAVDFMDQYYSSFKRYRSFIRFRPMILPNGPYDEC